MPNVSRVICPFASIYAAFHLLSLNDDHFLSKDAHNKIVIRPNGQIIACTDHLFFVGDQHQAVFLSDDKNLSVLRGDDLPVQDLIVWISDEPLADHEFKASDDAAKEIRAGLIKEGSTMFHLPSKLSDYFGRAEYFLGNPIESKIAGFAWDAPLKHQVLVPSTETILKHADDFVPADVSSIALSSQYLSLINDINVFSHEDHEDFLPTFAFSGDKSLVKIRLPNIKGDFYLMPGGGYEGWEVDDEK